MAPVVVNAREFLSETKRFPVFSLLSAANRKRLAQRAVARTFKKDEHIWRRGEPSDFCILVTDGVVDLGNTKRTGENYSIGLFGRGEVIGLSAVLRQQGFLASMKAASKTVKLWQIFLKDMEDDLNDEDCRNFDRWQKQVLIIHEQALRDKILLQSAGAVSDRLLETFNLLRLRFSPETPLTAKKIFIPFPISKTQIARLIGCRVETVIRTLNQWERLGFVQLTETGVTLINFHKQLPSAADPLINSLQPAVGSDF